MFILLSFCTTCVYDVVFKSKMLTNSEKVLKMLCVLFFQTCSFDFIVFSGKKKKQANGLISLKGVFVFIFRIHKKSTYIFQQIFYSTFFYNSLSVTDSHTHFIQLFIRGYTKNYQVKSSC